MPARLADAARELQDPKTPFDCVQKLVDEHSWFEFGKDAQSFPERVIRVIVERLQKEPEAPLSTYLLTALNEPTALERDWAHAIEGMLDLLSVSNWGSTQLKATVAGLARGPLLPAIQAEVSRGTAQPLTMLAVLAADGSEASVDALMPHFQIASATNQNDLLNRLELLKTHAAKTGPMTLMLESVQKMLSKRNDQSPALAFARSIGLDVNTLSVCWCLSSEQTEDPEFLAAATIDSRSPSWFQVTVAHMPNGLTDQTTFGSEGTPTIDKLGLGRCTPEELPVWFARAAKKLKVRWSVTLWNSNLRGAKRERALAWMRGDEPSAQVKEPKARTRRGRAGSR